LSGHPGNKQFVCVGAVISLQSESIPASSVDYQHIDAGYYEAAVGGIASAAPAPA